MTRLRLFDWGAGNLHSLAKALTAAGATVEVTRDWSEALDGDGLVLPGVGAFGPAASTLPTDTTPIRDALRSGFPCLGVCLGMQLLFERSDEAEGGGLGVIPGTVRQLRAETVPQMGWNDVSASSDPLLTVGEPLVVYYANSFVCQPDDDRHAIAWTTHEGDRFPAAVRVANCWGVQFHPEKSSMAGQDLLRRFIGLVQDHGEEAQR